MLPVATGDQPTYDLTLSDGVSTVGFLAGGERGFAEGALRRLPRGPGAERKRALQRDWSSGRGSERFAEDATRFFDSKAVWSMVPGQLLPAPLMRWGSIPALSYGGYQQWPGDPVQQLGSFQKTLSWHSLISGFTFLADLFQGTATTPNICRGWLVIRRRGTPTGNLRFAIHNSAGSPSEPTTILQSVTVAPGAIPDYQAVLYEFALPAAAAISAGTKYFVSIGQASGSPDLSNHWQVLIFTDWAVTSNVYQSTDGSTWTPTTLGGGTALVFRLNNHLASDPLTRGQLGGGCLFFQYKRQLYAIVNPASGSPVVLMNGDRGVCTGTQQVDRITDTSKAWALGAWTGLVVMITSGPMRGQYRQIADMGSTYLVVDKPWTQTPIAGAGGTEYVILGSDTWIQRFTLSAPATDVAVLNEIGYIALGDSTNLRRFREYNNAGAWVIENADDGTNRATFLEPWQEGAKVYLCRARNDTVAFSKAERVGWGTNLTFDTEIPVGDASLLATGLTIYDDIPHVMKEDKPYAIKNGAAAEIPIGTDDVPDLANGVNARQWNTNLYFPFLDGLERLYGQTVDDIGPNRGQGLPADRRGKVADFRRALQYGFAAWDGGEAARYSAVLATVAPGGAWHELFRSDTPNRRIQNLYYQNIPGYAPNRLWFNLGLDLCYLAMPSTTQNPLGDSAMLYTWEGAVVTGWFDFDTEELDHFFDELRVFSRGLNGTSRLIEVDYQLDDAEVGSPWTPFAASFTTSPMQALSIGGGSVTGRRIRFRLRLVNLRPGETIVVNAVELRAVQMNEVLYDFVLDFRQEDKLQLVGQAETAQTTAQALATLETWKESATPLTVRVRFAPFDNFRGHIDPVSLVPANWHPDRSGLVGSLTIKQV